MHLYLAEAISKMKLEAFENWLVTRNKYRIYDEMKENGYVQIFKQSQNTENFECCVEEFRPLLELFEEFEQLFPNSEEYQTLSDFFKSIKNGDWNLHMCTSEKMLHWFHVYDNYNYARHFSYYWASQQTLPEHHPTVYEEFKAGGFLFNIPLVNSTKYPLIKLFRRP